jgi:hypothetical protein
MCEALFECMPALPLLPAVLCQGLMLPELSSVPVELTGGPG